MKLHAVEEGRGEVAMGSGKTGNLFGLQFLDEIKLVRTAINMSGDHNYILKLNIKKVMTMVTDGMREKRGNKT